MRKILFDDRGDGALADGAFFTDQRKRILVHQKEECDIVVPQIFVKAVVRRKDKEPFELHLDLPDDLLPVVAAAVYRLKNLAEAVQNAVLVQVAVHE